MNFEELKLNRQLLNAIEEAGYTEPTEIQLKAIPQILAGHDIIGVAQTGTGKTAAYALPILMKIKYAQGHNPRAVIFGPTRELVMQIEIAVKQFAKYTDLRIVALYGGVGTKLQKEHLQKGVDIIIATPGRFLDLYLEEEFVLKEVKTMVLDEADKMMDMGFMPQLRKMLEVIPRKRQNLLFSATMSERVERLTEEFLEYPMKIEVTPQATPATLISQKLYTVPNFKTKIHLLEYLIRKDETVTRAIIFVRTKKSADDIYKFIVRKTTNTCRIIHANKDQNSRINAMDDFKDGSIKILVATDVASRGIDVREVSHVINFDVPIIYDDYIHRIGRTGRANHTGVAITFATEAELYHIHKIEKIIRMPIPVEELPSEVEITETGFEEAQEFARELDFYKKKEDPTYKGAFHEKKRELKTENKSSTFKPGKASKPKVSKANKPQPKAKPQKPKAPKKPK
ncbi:DEAD/DEAH box helicase [Cytophaga aurantiaca]|uniref:DEAD/DEAH box helicase n=1 Tax=Cytophaga aurantiaca TaxID=29530 RepID=UPI000367E2F8